MASAFASLQIVSPAAAFELFAPLAPDGRERIAVAYLDRRHRLIDHGVQPRGEPGWTVVPAAAVMGDALRRGAAYLILAHNHPSGDPAPSLADIRATRRLAEAASALGLCLLDHVIVARGGCRSLRLMGFL